MIYEKVKKQIIDAMKARDELRTTTLKMLSSALHNAEIAKQRDLNEEEELDIVRHEAKKRKDAIEAYGRVPDKAQAQKRIEREEAELKILKEFLPQQLSDDELEKIVKLTISELGAADIKEMGRVIGTVMGKVKGVADGGKVADLVKSKLL